MAHQNAFVNQDLQDHRMDMVDVLISMNVLHLTHAHQELFVKMNQDDSDANALRILKVIHSSRDAKERRRHLVVRKTPVRQERNAFEMIFSVLVFAFVSEDILVMLQLDSVEILTNVTNSVINQLADLTLFVRIFQEAMNASV